MYFKKRLFYKQKREKYLTSTYEKLMSNWMKNIENKSNSITKLRKDLRTREYFEKQFAELKRAREEKQSKKQQQSKSTDNNENPEFDINQQQQQLEAELEAENKRMRSLAVIPPILLDDKLRKYKFFNKNGLVRDPVTEHEELKVLINYFFNLFQ